MPPYVVGCVQALARIHYTVVAMSSYGSSRTRLLYTLWIAPTKAFAVTNSSARLLGVALPLLQVLSLSVLANNSFLKIITTFLYRVFRSWMSYCPMLYGDEFYLYMNPDRGLPSSRRKQGA